MWCLTAPLMLYVPAADVLTSQLMASTFCFWCGHCRQVHELLPLLHPSSSVRMRSSPALQPAGQRVRTVASELGSPPPATAAPRAALRRRPAGLLPLAAGVAADSAPAPAAVPEPASVRCGPADMPACTQLCVPVKPAPAHFSWPCRQARLSTTVMSRTQVGKASQLAMFLQRLY